MDTKAGTQRLQTLSLKQTKDYHFSESSVDQATRKKIEEAITSLEGTKLEHDLKISMPRLEAVDLASALREQEAESAAPEDEDEDESLVHQCNSHLELLNRFNNYVGQGIEELIGAQLNGPLRGRWTDRSDLLFIRNAVQFPDLYLVAREQKRVLLSIEVKSWFVFSGDNITARFHAAPNIIRPGSLLVLFPWCMSNLVFGTPVLLRPYIGDAKALAERRDRIWEAGGFRNFKRDPRKSPDFRVILPVVDPDHPTALNVTKTNAEAQQRKNGTWEKESDNFGKIWRIYEPTINEDFYPRTMRWRLLGKSIEDWNTLLES